MYMEGGITIGKCRLAKEYNYNCTGNTWVYRIQLVSTLKHADHMPYSIPYSHPYNTVALVVNLVMVSSSPCSKPVLTLQPLTEPH